MMIDSTMRLRLILVTFACSFLIGCSEAPRDVPGSELTDSESPANLPPSVRVLEPSDGARAKVGETVRLLVAAEDQDGTAVELVLEEGGRVLSRAVGPAPLELAGEFTPAAAGDYTITATASDDEGASAKAGVTISGWTEVSEPSASAFTLVALPDTQNMVKSHSGDMFERMTAWVVENVDELGIAFVTHVGDVVGGAGDLGEWALATAALDRLDDAVPYSVALGDHEYEIEENMGSSVENYLRFFGPQRYQEYDWYAGASVNGKNHYQIFEAGDREFLHLALEWEAPGPLSDPESPLGWARTVIESHPDLPTIITTHAYIWDHPGYEGRTWREGQLEGYIEEENGERSYPGTTGQGIFEALVEPFPQVFMVLNGHYHKGNGTDNGEYHQVSFNSAGLEVYEMLANYQDYPNGGDGWLRLIEFAPGAGEGSSDRIQVRTYSPLLEEYQTDERSAFHFDLDFEARFDLD